MEAAIPVMYTKYEFVDLIYPRIENLDLAPVPIPAKTHIIIKVHLFQELHCKPVKGKFIHITLVEIEFIALTGL